MVTIDSLKIVLPADVCSPVLSKYNERTVLTAEGLKTNTFDVITPIEGIKYLQYRPAYDDFIVEISAKALGKKDYKKLISLDTIEQVAEALTGTGLVKIHVADLIECGNVLKVDYCNNLFVDDVDAFLAAINAISNDNFIKTPYKGKGKGKGTIQSVVFIGTLTTRKDRLLCYNKFIESKDYQFKGMLRIERNVTDLKTIRAITGYTNNLTDCLIVKESPTLKMFNKIVSDNKISNDFMAKVKNKDIDLMDRLAYDMLLKECGNDMQIVTAALKTHYSERTAYRKIKKLEQYSRVQTVGIECNDYLSLIGKMLADTYQN